MISTHIDSDKENNKDVLNLKIVIMLKYQNVNMFVIKKVENNMTQTYVISDFNGKKLLERFTKKNCKKQIKKSLRRKK